ncbi:MAG: hypothetical protein HY879_02610 [Deltaproteobacteria bacterium]|nr:hypothetical protein [Deltaproteobacteria bacterium]
MAKTVMEEVHWPGVGLWPMKIDLELLSSRSPHPATYEKWQYFHRKAITVSTKKSHYFLDNPE